MHIYLTPIQIPKWIFCYNKVHNKFVHVANSRPMVAYVIFYCRSYSSFVYSTPFDNVSDVSLSPQLTIS